MGEDKSVSKKAFSKKFSQKKKFQKKKIAKNIINTNEIQSTSENEDIKPEEEKPNISSDENYIKLESKTEKREKSGNENDHEYTVFVKNISYDSTNEDLEECFKKFGPIKYALIVRDPVSGHSKGTGFVRFLKKESASICLQQSGKIVLQYFTLELLPSLPRNKIKEIQTEKENEKHEPKDKRNLYLMREGTILAGSAAAEGVSATDMATRLRLEQIKSSMLKNLNRFISRERLTIHNLPEHYDDDKLRKMVISRTGLKPIECRVMRENKPTPAHPKGKPKGFGFLSFKRHEDALTVLRKLNNNPDVFSEKHRPIVSFSIEDLNVLKIKEKRKIRSMVNNPTYQKKLEKLKAKKSKKLEKKLEKKPNAGNKLKKINTVDVDDAEESYAGCASKPGSSVRLRGTFKLKEQSRIHEKSMREKNKKLRRERQILEARRDKDDGGGKLARKVNNKRKFVETDALDEKINKYKNLLQQTAEPNAKKKKLQGKWSIE